MTQKKFRFAIFGNEYQACSIESLETLLSVLRHYNAEICIDNQLLSSLQLKSIETNRIETFEGEDFRADFVISMGGDGTFLKAAALVGNKNIPIIGINMGRLGFLADTMPCEIENAIKELYAGNYKLEAHSVISATVNDGDYTNKYYALNEIALLKRDTAAMISICTTIDSEFLATYQADGLIVATPTGSTAYSLSNGGPIMVSNADILCLTPVAPHSLNIRPVVIDANSEITLTVESRSHNFLLAVDGRSTTLDEGATVTIKKASYAINIVKFKGKHYYSTLREKMMWGVFAINN